MVMSHKDAYTTAAVVNAAPMYGELLGSTVGSCWDRPSALLPINRQLDHL
jgi:hypothetical protein